MRCYQQNQALLDRVWKRIDLRFRRYPKPLRALAKTFIASLGPKPQRYFSGPDAGPLLHFPIWLARARARRALPDLLEASALAYFYVRIQDNVVDEPGTRGQTPLLLLGNVLLSDAIALTSALVPSTSFWTRARHAWTVFSAETEAERAQIARRAGYDPRAFRRHARKVALARIPLYAVLAIDGRATRVAFANVDRLIDRMGESYGLVNDVLGCYRDLTSGTRTYLLSSAATGSSRKSGKASTPIEQALVARPWFERFLTRAVRIHRRSLSVGQALGIRQMERYTEERIARIEWHIQQATTLRMAVALAPKKARQ